jgi:Ca-activated chloride channel homolog
MSLGRAALILLALLAGPFIARAQPLPTVRIAVPDGPRMVIANPAESPVRLGSLRIDAEVRGGLALTTVEMAFHNPNRRVLEGELQFPLREGQSVVGFALDVDGRMRDAMPVDKARGQAVFEDITRARVDPGLLQVTQGNNYKLRVYPIPAQGVRRVVLRIAEVLVSANGRRTYRMPLDYSDRIEQLDVAVWVSGAAGVPAIDAGALGAMTFRSEGGQWVATAQRSQYAGKGALAVTIPSSDKPFAVVQRFEDKQYFHAELPVRTLKGARGAARVVQLVWDSSGSMAGRDVAKELGLLDAYLRALGNVEVRLVRVRDAAEPAERHRIVAGNWSVLRRSLEGTAYDGGTNLGSVPLDADAQEVLLFSDGLSNFGEGRFTLRGVPVFTVSSAARSDAALLRYIADATGGRYIDLAVDSRDEALAKLRRTGTRIVSLEGDGVGELLVASMFPDRGRIAVAGVVTGRAGTVRVIVEHPGGKRETVEAGLPAESGDGRLVPGTWASLKVAQLEGEHEFNRGEIRRIGRAFALATRETSLIVLERVEDYARYEIDPPRELAEAYGRLRANANRVVAADRQSHLERIVKLLEEKQSWWNREYPKGDRPGAKKAEQKVAAGAIGGRAPGEADRMLMRENAAPAMSVASPAAAPEPRRDGRAKDAISFSEAASGTSIRLRAWTPDSPYATRMREAGADRVYRIYMDERPDYVRSSAFFLDAADILLEKGQPDLAVRVLSNLAEMDLENRHVLRILGYRLLQAGRPALAVPVFRKVLALAPEEPQSFRDLGLAYAGDRKYQKAVDSLYEVVVKPWHGRFPEIELITLADMNAIIATAGEKLDLARIDPRLLKNLPLDLRVVLTWDADNTDIDLWVMDPNGERAYYGNRMTYQGGRMSLDFTGGYGPEEFSLKNAKPGVYKVQANFFGHRQQIVAGATTLQVKLTTGFGTPLAKEQIVTLRLKGQSEVVEVGEFEVR